MNFPRSIVDTVGHPLLVLDAEERVVAANSAFYRDFKLVPGETLGRPFFKLGGGIWDVPKLRTLLREGLASDGTFEGCEIEQDIPNLGRRCMLLGARQVTRDDNSALMILLAIEDDRKRRQDRDVLQRLYSEMEGLVAERTIDLQVANLELRHAVEDLAAVNRELEAFCCSVSHDLRTPPRAVEGFSQDLVQAHTGQVDPRGQHYLRRIRAGTQRMGQLIEDLLALSRDLDLFEVGGRLDAGVRLRGQQLRPRAAGL